MSVNNPAFRRTTNTPNTPNTATHLPKKQEPETGISELKRARDYIKSTGTKIKQRGKEEEFPIDDAAKPNEGPDSTLSLRVGVKTIKVQTTNRVGDKGDRRNRL